MATNDSLLLEVEELDEIAEHYGLNIIMMGKSGAGKSTLINKLIESDENIMVFPKPGTTKIEQKKGKGTLMGVDVQGLEPTKRKEWVKILKKVRKFGEGKASLVLLCIPVGPSNNFTDATPKMMKYMQKIMGKEVWKFCIVVFTFSNVARLIETDNSKYVKYLQNYTDRFKEELIYELKVKDVGVMSFFAYNKENPEDIKNTIVTIPAGKGDEDKVIPGSTQTWSDDLADLIDKKCAHMEYQCDMKARRVAATTNRVGTGSVIEAEKEAERKSREETSQWEGRMEKSEERAREEIIQLERRLATSEERAREAERRLEEAERRSREETSQWKRRLETSEERTREAERRLQEAERRGEERSIRLHQLETQWVVERREIQLTGPELGRGGWATVTVAVFRGTHVAAKCIHHLITSKHNVRLFQREMDMAARIRHPNLVQFIGATQEGEMLILTELMPTSLRRELNRENMSLSIDNAKSIGLDVVRALNYLHLMQPDPIIHRDISSGNVLLEPLPQGHWRAKVSDYGTVNLLQKLQIVGPGNPNYAAPEANDSRLQSPKMDIFSFGVLLIEMLTGEFPSSDEREHLVSMIHHQQLLSLIQRCLSERPEERPNASDIITELEN